MKGMTRRMFASLAGVVVARPGNVVSGAQRHNQLSAGNAVVTAYQAMDGPVPEAKNHSEWRGEHKPREASNG